MLQIIEHKNFREVVATDGYLHKVGSNNYTDDKRAILLPNETIEDYEEVMELPKCPKEQYDAKVDELIRSRYSASEVEGIFRKVLSGDVDARGELENFNAFAEQCKIEAMNPDLYKNM